MTKILIISFLFLSFNAFGEAIQDWNPWSSIKKNLDDLIIKSIIVNSKNIGAARIVKDFKGINNFDTRIFKDIKGIKNLDVSKPIFAEEIERIEKLDDRKCIFWFDGTKFCVFK